MNSMQWIKIRGEKAWRDSTRSYLVREAALGGYHALRTIGGKRLSLDPRKPPEVYKTKNVAEEACEKHSDGRLQEWALARREKLESCRRQAAQRRVKVS